MVDVSSKDVADWWESFIEYVRDESVSPRHIIGDLRSTCQIEVFWLSVPIEGQSIVITDDEDRPDKEIIVNGPIEGDEFVQYVAEVSQEDRWQQPVPTSHYGLIGQGQKTRADILAGVIRRFVNNIQQSILRDYSSVSSPFLGARRLWGNSSATWALGNVAVYEIKDLHRETNEDERNSDSIESFEEDDDKNDDVSDGTESGGAYIYPPVWLDEAPTQTFTEKVWDYPYRNYEMVLQTEVGGNEFVARQDGLLLVTNSDLEEILQTLNLLFGIGIFANFIHWRTFQPRELISGSLDSGGLRTSLAELSTPSRRNQVIPPQSALQGVPRSIVPSEEIQRLLEYVEVVFPNEILREQITLHLQAHTHLLDDEYTASFLLNWNIIEQHIDEVLNRNLRDDYAVNRERRDKIHNGRNWFISHKIELAEITSTIDYSMYSILDDLRSLRNRVVHDMETIGVEKAEDIDHLVSELVVRSINSQLRNHDIDPIEHLPLPIKRVNQEGDYDPVKW